MLAVPSTVFVAVLFVKVGSVTDVGVFAVQLKLRTPSSDTLADQEAADPAVTLPVLEQRDAVTELLLVMLGTLIEVVASLLLLGDTVVVNVAFVPSAVSVVAVPRAVMASAVPVAPTAVPLAVAFTFVVLSAPPLTVNFVLVPRTVSVVLLVIVGAPDVAVRYLEATLIAGIVTEPVTVEVEFVPVTVAEWVCVLEALLPIALLSVISTSWFSRIASLISPIVSSVSAAPSPTIASILPST